MGKPAKILIGIVTLVMVGALLYYHLTKWHQQRLDQAVSVERAMWKDKTETLEKKVEELAQELDRIEGSYEAEENVAEGLDKRISFEEIENQVEAFFAHLDRQPYVAAYQFKGGTYEQYQESVALLTATPPAIKGESDSLHRLYQNMAHFFRVLGKNRIKLTIDVLANESESIESVMRLFYLWYSTDDGGVSRVAGRPSPQIRTLYASYFLNTLAGRSYLMRRDSKVRLLTSYYCVRILDQANDEGINSIGIDIRPHIQAIYRDLQGHRGLSFRRDYEDGLEELARKYKVELQ